MDDDQVRVSILIKSGNLTDFQTLALLASGFISSDFSVKIFAMNDAVSALTKENVGTDTVVRSNNQEFASKFSDALSDGKAIPWWKLLADLKEFGEITITVCALVADVIGLEKEDFHELVDEVAGVATFAADVEDSDYTITL
jgi:peroxiredoxin family protein